MNIDLNVTDAPEGDIPVVLKYLASYFENGGILEPGETWKVFYEKGKWISVSGVSMQCTETFVVRNGKYVEDI